MKKILIINANYYKDISNRLVLSAKKELKKKRFNIKLINIPGIYEIPTTLAKYIKKFDGFVVVGCVIKGETPHFNLISQSVFISILDISIKFKKPIGNGIITCLNKKQANMRSLMQKKTTKPNKGSESAKAVISLIENEPKSL